MTRDKSIAGLGSALLLVAMLAAYSNHFRNGLNFDDWHTIVNNTSIRDLRNILRFFLDATTFSAVPGHPIISPAGLDSARN